MDATLLVPMNVTSFLLHYLLDKVKDEHRWHCSSRCTRSSSSDSRWGPTLQHCPLGKSAFLHSPLHQCHAVKGLMLILTPRHLKTHIIEIWYLFGINWTLFWYLFRINWTLLVSFTTATWSTERMLLLLLLLFKAATARTPFHELQIESRVTPNARSVTPRYGGFGFLVYYIYDDTW